jgi:hypothetical protein
MHATIWIVNLPNGDQAFVPPEKLSGYLLAVNHPIGGPKARFFIALGYRTAAPEELEQAILMLARTGMVRRTERSNHGIKYVVDGVVTAPMGQPAAIRTVWIVPMGDLRPRLVTAYPSP